MPLPRAQEARPFYRAAIQRFSDAELLDAELLLEWKRTTGAIYLAGYGIECMLKALLLESVGKRMRGGILRSFRGARAHDFEWLRAEYRNHGGAAPSLDIARNFLLVNSWTTSLRYKPGTVRPADAEVFLKATREIIQWADGRL